MKQKDRQKERKIGKSEERNARKERTFKRSKFVGKMIYQAITNVNMKRRRES